MNRRQKIIVSVTGIFIVLLILVGLTYAYFLTQITGNTNEKSISVTTANLVLEYGDGNNILEPATKLVPNTVVGTKTFTATNKGDDTVEDYLVYFENVNNSLLRPEDLVYTVTCKSYKTTDYNTNGDNATETGACNGVSMNTQLPTGDGNGTAAILTNTIEEGYIHVYALELKYLEAGIDQSDDMNKTVTAKINIVDSKGLNPYKGNTNSLAYNIVNNAMNVTDEQKTLHYAEFRKKPLTTPLAQASLESESVLSLTPDDYGVSYYYRGNVENNYVTFNEMCWRIVRIQGDGSIKLILADDEAGCSTATASKVDSISIGSGAYNSDTCADSRKCADYINGDMRRAFNTWVKGTEFTDATRKVLKNDTWCVGNLKDAYDSTGNVVGTVTAQKEAGASFNYDGHARFYKKTPSLICDTTGENGEVDTNIIGTLTMDEVAYAGGGSFSNKTYYINKNITNNYWWILTRNSSNMTQEQTFIIGFDGDMQYSVVDAFDDYMSRPFSYRPAITLKSNTEINSGGLGTLNNPYVIKTS